MAPRSNSGANDTTRSDSLGHDRIMNGIDEKIGKEAEKSIPAASAAQSSDVERHEHTDLSNWHLSMILGSLWVGYSEL